jgi:hypothetical protein
MTIVHPIQPVHYFDRVVDVDGSVHFYEGYQEVNHDEATPIIVQDDGNFNPDVFVYQDEKVTIIKNNDKLLSYREGELTVIFDSKVQLAFKVFLDKHETLVVVVHEGVLKWFDNETEKFLNFAYIGDNTLSEGIRLIRNECVLANDGSAYLIGRDRYGSATITNLRAPYRMVDLIKKYKNPSHDYYTKSFDYILALDKFRSLHILYYDEWERVDTPLLRSIGIHSFLSLHDRSKSIDRQSIHVIGGDSNPYRFDVKIVDMFIVMFEETHIKFQLKGVSYPGGPREEFEEYEDYELHYSDEENQSDEEELEEYESDDENQDSSEEDDGDDEDYEYESPYEDTEEYTED